MVNEKTDKLKINVAAIDNIVKILQIDNQTMNEKEKCITEIQEFEASRLLDLRQKSKCKWPLEGDENTGFFHGLLNYNLNFSRINGD